MATPDHEHAPRANEAMFLSYVLRDGARLGEGRCAVCNRPITCYKGDPKWYAAGERPAT